jgi:hypothetical protein
MIIIPQTKKYEDVKGVKRISYCYLHGQLEADAEYDVFGFLDFIADVPQDDDGEYYINHEIIKDGVYPCQFEGKPCTFFYWHNEYRVAGHAGLVVYNDDIKSYEYAKKCYENKNVNI